MFLPAPVRLAIAAWSLAATPPAVAHDSIPRPARAKTAAVECGEDLAAGKELASAQLAKAAAAASEPSSAPGAVTKSSVPTEEGPVDDPYSAYEMKLARAAAKAVQPGLTDWSFKVEKLNLTKVNRTLGKLESLVTMEAPGFRLLFGVVGRYLLNAKGADGRLRPLADTLKVTEAQARLLVNFFSQLDTLILRRDRVRGLPTFLTKVDQPGERLMEDIGARKPDDEAETFVRGPLAEVLGERVRYARISLDQTGNQITLRSPVGIYKINLRRNLKNRPTIAAVDIRTTTAWGRQNDSVIHSLIDVNLDDASAVSYLRTMIRADAFFHPHLVPPTLEAIPQPTRPSPMQKKQSRALMEADREIEANMIRQGLTGPVELANAMTTGSGKTPVFADYFKELVRQRWDGRLGRIIFVVQNQNILRQTLISLQRDLEADPNLMYLMFGKNGPVKVDLASGEVTIQHGAGVRPGPGWKFVFTTRSTLAARHDWLIEELTLENTKPAAERTPTVLAFDEAHHLETEGQYAGLLKIARELMRNEDRITYMSATFASKKRNLVTEVFGGNIVASDLFPEELAEMRRGENLDHWALVQYLRAAIDGYVNPIDDESFTLVDAETSVEELRERLNKNEVADAELYKQVATRIRAIRRPGVVDRWMFFDITQERANQGAEFLREFFGDLSARAMHSDLPDEVQLDTLEWFKDGLAHRGSRAHHKYNISVGQAVEGTDVPSANGAAFMRNVVLDRTIQQIIGRVARLRAFKSGIYLADPTGRAVRYLSGARELWEKVRQRPGASVITDWRAPAPERLAKPTAEDIAAENFQIAEKLKAQHEAIVKRREAEVEQLKIFLSPVGALKSFALNPTTGVRDTAFDPKARLAQWFNLFPAAGRASFEAELRDLTWSSPKIDLNRLKAADAIQLRAGVNILVRVYNALAPEQRRFLSNVKAPERATAIGVAPVFATLTQNHAFTPSPSQTFAAWTFEQRETFQSLVTKRKLFANDSTLARAATTFANETPVQILKLIPQILTGHRRLDNPAVERLLLNAGRALFAARENNDPLQPVAIYHLSLLANHLLGMVEKPPRPLWDLNAAFGRAPNPDLTQPSMFEFWMMLGSVDTALVSPNGRR